MLPTLNKEKIARLAQYKREVDAWEAKHGPAPLVPVVSRGVVVKSRRQRDNERFQRECVG